MDTGIDALEEEMEKKPAQSAEAELLTKLNQEEKGLLDYSNFSKLKSDTSKWISEAALVTGEKVDALKSKVLAGEFIGVEAPAGLTAALQSLLPEKFESLWTEATQWTQSYVEKAKAYAEKLPDLTKMDYSSAAMLAIGAAGAAYLANTVWNWLSGEEGETKTTGGQVLKRTAAIGLMMAGAYLGKEKIGSLLEGMDLLGGKAKETASKAYEDLKEKGSAAMLDTLLTGYDPDIEAKAEELGVSQFVLSRLKEVPATKFMQYKSKDKKAPYIWRYLNAGLPQFSKDVFKQVHEDEATLAAQLNTIAQSKQFPANASVWDLLTKEPTGLESAETAEVVVMTPEEMAENHKPLKTWLDQTKAGEFDSIDESATAFVLAVKDSGLNISVYDGVMGVLDIAKNVALCPITATKEFFQAASVVLSALAPWNWHDSTVSGTAYDYFEVIGNDGFLEEYFGEGGAVASGAIQVFAPAAVGGLGVYSRSLKLGEAGTMAGRGALMHWSIPAKVLGLETKLSLGLVQSIDVLSREATLKSSGLFDRIHGGNRVAANHRDYAQYHAERYRYYYELKHGRASGILRSAGQKANEAFKLITGHDPVDQFLRHHGEAYITNRDGLHNALTLRGITDNFTGMNADTLLKNTDPAEAQQELMREIEGEFQDSLKNSAEFNDLGNPIDRPEKRRGYEYDAAGYRELPDTIQNRLYELGIDRDTQLKFRELAHEGNLSDLELNELLDQAEADPSVKKVLIEVLQEKKYSISVAGTDVSILKALKSADKVMTAWELISTIQGYSTATDKSAFLAGTGLDAAGFWMGNKLTKHTLGRLTGNRLAQEAIGVVGGIATVMIGGDTVKEYYEYYGEDALLRNFPNHDAYLSHPWTQGAVDAISVATAVTPAFNFLDLMDTKFGTGLGDSVDETRDPIEYLGKTLRLFNPLGEYWVNEYRDRSVKDLESNALITLKLKKQELEMEELKDGTDPKTVEKLKTAIARLEDFVDGSWIHSEKARMKNMQYLLVKSRDTFEALVKQGTRANPEESTRIYREMMARIWRKGAIDVQAGTEQALWTMLADQKIQLQTMDGQVIEQPFFTFVMQMLKFKKDLSVFKTLEKEMGVAEEPRGGAEALAA